MGIAYRVGTSGWHYLHWRGTFYPPSLPTSEWLGWYQRHFDTVEINSSFYRLPSTATASAWGDAAPAGFTFAVKASRYLTHMKKLQSARPALARFLAVCQALGKRCGPLLFQLPPGWKCDPPRLAAFLGDLPERRECAFELRDPSWHVDAIYALLERHNAAFCIYDLKGCQSPRPLTADFAYLRLHGPGPQAYCGSYGPAALAGWADSILAWKHLRRVYVYFDNDEAGHAVRDALDLRRLLDAGQGSGPPTWQSPQSGPE
jgi:uncharacterized protein YecE (DUF72 family)